MQSNLYLLVVNGKCGQCADGKMKMAGEPEYILLLSNESGNELGYELTVESLSSLP